MQLIEESGQDVEVINYLQNAPTPAELKVLLKQLDMSAEALVRKGEAIYKSELKGKELSEDEWIEAMCRYPKLIERPIVVHEGKAIVARPPELVNEWLNSKQ